MSWMSDIGEAVNTVIEWAIKDTLIASEAIKPRTKGVKAPKIHPAPEGSNPNKSEAPKQRKKNSTPLSTKPSPHYNIRPELRDKLGNIGPNASTPLQRRIQCENTNNLLALLQHKMTQDKMFNMDLSKQEARNQREQRHDHKIHHSRSRNH
jgi:hypothetical protein